LRTFTTKLSIDRLRPQVLTLIKMTTTSNIVNEFVNIVDNDKVYDLKELKTILGEIYKTKTSAAKKTKGEKKAKRAPTSYNIFIGTNIKKMRTEDPSLTAKEAMKKAGAKWKEMSDDEKNEYKAKLEK